MADNLDRKITRDDEEEAEAAVKPTRSFRYEDYSTRRVFLRSYPLQWDWSPAPEEKQPPPGGGGGGEVEEEELDCGGSGRIRWKRQVAVAVAGWGEEKLLLLRRVKKRLALYLIGCHYGHRRALPFKPAGSGTAAMLASR
ncbi:uncharacterized protein LOC102714299 [Oryza brachyantha]|uniref:uncharacterized protein LOC102714299 n=1 Tax=Oryza brachyantha TaxID=4533 RepID=UPI001AD9D0B3|nr:uncharacterized protein LOC102714299 [Oryza brachyantha]